MSNPSAQKQLSEFYACLREQVLLPILRMDDAETCLRLSQALRANGFGILEITLDTPDALSLIGQMAADKACIGAGTVITAQQATQAIEQGACFLVSPGLSAEIAGVAREAGVAYFPGVLTSTEVMQAMSLGLTHLKLFPASLGGPDYLQQLKGPFPQIEWLVTGGIPFTEIPAWRAAGVLAVGFGKRIVSPRHLAAGNWKAIEAELQQARRNLDATE